MVLFVLRSEDNSVYVDSKGRGFLLLSQQSKER
jgi:hypothetical protein